MAAFERADDAAGAAAKIDKGAGTGFRDKPTERIAGLAVRQIERDLFRRGVPRHKRNCSEGQKIDPGRSGASVNEPQWKQKLHRQPDKTKTQQ